MFNSSAWTRMGVNGCGCIGCHSPDRPSLTPARGSTTRATYCFRRTGAKGLRFKVYECRGAHGLGPRAAEAAHSQRVRQDYLGVPRE